MAYASAGIAYLSIAFGILLIVASALQLPTTIRRMLAARKLYGGWPRGLARDVYNYAAFGPLKVNRDSRQVWLILFVVGVGVDIAVRRWGGLLDDWSHWLLWIPFVVGFLLWRFILYIKIATPPAALLLGPSCEEVEWELAWLNVKLRPFRTVALIRPDREPLQFGAGRGVSLHNFRTRDLYQWRTVVFHLMDVVPILILCDDEREPVREEKARIERHGYWDRTIVTSRERLADPQEGVDFTRTVAERLAVVRDQAERRARQATFTAIRRAVPSSIRYPVDLNDFMLKARYLAIHAQNEFSRRCKVPGSSGASSAVVDQPSLVGPEEERRFLRENRALEEIEIVLKSVEEVIGDERGPMWDFNRANVVNRWGHLAGVRQDWDESRRQLESAIERYERLLPVAPPDLRLMTIQELGTAWFNLGDACLAQYRQSQLAEHRDRARACYAASIDYDRLAGRVDGIAERRMASL